MSHKTSDLVFRISIGIFLLLLGATALFDHPVFAAIGGVIAIFGTLQTLIYDRCPNCEEHLQSYLKGNLKYCPYCGEKLDDE